MEADITGMVDEQGTEQSATDFMSRVELEASRAGITGDQLRCVVVQRLYHMFFNLL